MRLASLAHDLLCAELQFSLGHPTLLHRTVSFGALSICFRNSFDRNTTISAWIGGSIVGAEQCKCRTASVVQWIHSSSILKRMKSRKRLRTVGAHFVSLCIGHDWIIHLDGSTTPTTVLYKIHPALYKLKKDLDFEHYKPYNFRTYVVEWRDVRLCAFQLSIHLEVYTVLSEW